MKEYLIQRPRRNRKSAALRALVRETTLSPDDLIAPLFLIPGKDKREPILSLPGCFRYTLDQLLLECDHLIKRGIKCVCLFPALPPSLKSKECESAYNPQGPYPLAIREIKSTFPQLLVMTDVALDPYNSEGHDGLVDAVSGDILNDPTLEVLGKMAVVQAKAGADIIGPSDMMDGRVRWIRECLDEANFCDVSIMSYTAKYVSSFYGPFRDALDSSPKSGDKKTYQMDMANAREALREAKLDEAEGADILMIKPGLAYLDIISKVREKTHLPLAAYNVSGEYAMIKAAAARGWIDEPMAVLEILTAFKRAGADIILTYFSATAAELLNEF